VRWWPALAAAYVVVASSEAGASADEVERGAGAGDEAAADTPEAPTATAAGEVVVVTGSRGERRLDDAAAVTEVIDRAAIAASGAETVADALAQRPGVWLERGLGGTRIALEGLGPEYVLVLVDGQRQVGRVDGTLDLERLGVGDLERIEIVRGPSSALYGSDALGGVVNLITREPTAPEAEAVVRGDSRGGSDARARIAGGQGGWFGAASGEWRRAPAYDRTPDEPSTTIGELDEVRATGRGGRRDERGRLEVAADYLRRDVAGVDATATGAILDRRNLTEVVSGRLTGKRALPRRLQASGALAGQLFRDQFVSDQRGASALDQDQETTEGLVEGRAQLDGPPADGHYATVGVEVLREAIRSPRLDEPAHRWRIGTYAQHEWWLGAERRVLVSPAARFDHDTQFGSHATPHLAARWAIDDAVALRASAGLGYRAPGFRELHLAFENPGAGYVVEGNPALSPETSRSARLGAELRIGPAWLAVHGFWNELYDLIAVTAAGGDPSGPMRFSYANVGRARTRGGEAMATAGRGRLRGELGYALTIATDLEDRRRLEGIPRHRLTAAVRLDDLAGADASVEATLTGRRPFYVDAERPDAVTSASRRVELRARVARRFAWLTAFAGVDNLLGAGDDDLQPLAPRVFYGGASGRY
jgi:outer membrane receptor for ferrienterochelin and colicins